MIKLNNRFPVDFPVQIVCFVYRLDDSQEEIFILKLHVDNTYIYKIRQLHLLSRSITVSTSEKVQISKNINEPIPNKFLLVPQVIFMKRSPAKGKSAVQKHCGYRVRVAEEVCLL